MPNVFGTIERTEIVAFLATYGWRRFRELHAACGVNRPTMAGRLADAVRLGLLQKVRNTATISYYGLNRDHPAYWQIRALGRRLGEVYRMPRPRSNAQMRPRLGRRPAPSAAAGDLMVFSTLQSPIRSEILLFLAAVHEAVSLSNVSRVLGYPFRGIWRMIELLDTMGIVESTYVRNDRLVELNREWPAHHELRILLRRLRHLDPQWDAYAASYRGRRWRRRV